MRGMMIATDVAYKSVHASDCHERSKERKT